MLRQEEIVSGLVVFLLLLFLAGALHAVILFITRTSLTFLFSMRQA